MNRSSIIDLSGDSDTSDVLSDFEREDSLDDSERMTHSARVKRHSNSKVIRLFLESHPKKFADYPVLADMIDWQPDMDYRPRVRRMTYYTIKRYRRRHSCDTGRALSRSNLALRK